MITIPGSGNSTINRDGGEKQISLANMDSTFTVNVKINEDPTGFTIEASGRRGWRINRGIYQVIITATGSWEVTIQ